MAHNFNFSILTGTPIITPADIVGAWTVYYADPSGILRFYNPLNSGTFVASTFYPVTGAKATGGLSNVTTGHVTFTAGIDTVVYGASGNAFTSGPTVLGEPNFWIAAIGPNGQLLSVPAYTRTN